MLRQLFFRCIWWCYMPGCHGWRISWNARPVSKRRRGRCSHHLTCNACSQKWNSRYCCFIWWHRLVDFVLLMRYWSIRHSECLKELRIRACVWGFNMMHSSSHTSIKNWTRTLLCATTITYLTDCEYTSKVWTKYAALNANQSEYLNKKGFWTELYWWFHSILWDILSTSAKNEHHMHYNGSVKELHLPSQQRRLLGSLSPQPAMQLNCTSVEPIMRLIIWWHYYTLMAPK